MHDCIHTLQTCAEVTESPKVDGGIIDDLFTDEESEYSSEEHARLHDDIEVVEDVEEKLKRHLDILEKEGNSLIPK